MFTVDNLFGHYFLLLLLRGGAVDDAENFVFAHDDVFLAIEFDLLPRVLPEENEVARLDVERDARAVVLGLAVPSGNDLALLRLLLGRVRDDDPADLLFAFFEALDDEAIVERSDMHGFRLLTRVTGAGWAGPADRVGPAVRGS